MFTYSKEEELLRERKRLVSHGITSYEFDAETGRLLFRSGGDIYIVDVAPVAAGTAKVLCILIWILSILRVFLILQDTIWKLFIGWLFFQNSKVMIPTGNHVFKQYKHQNKVWNMFSVNDKDTRIVQVSSQTCGFN